MSSAGAKIWLAGPCQKALEKSAAALAALGVETEGQFVYDHCTKEQTLSMAAAAVFLCSDAASFITGITMAVDCGYTCI